MITIRRVVPAAVALTLVLASCGGSSDGGSEDSEPTPTVAATVADSVEDFTKVDGEENVEADADAEPAQTEPEDTAAEDTAAEDTAAEAAEDTAAESATTEAETTEAADEPTVGDPAADSIDVALSEWAIDAPTEYTAGEITFIASNGGNFPHEFVVIEGEGYESLPRAEGGAVLEDDLPTGALIGRTDRVSTGSSESLTVTLGPGNYVLLCNLGGGANSHAGKGQRLDVTVS